jgi:hypothetical protein
MEMTPVWKERKSKSPFPLFPHCLGKLANTASLPHSHSFGDDLGFLFSTSSFNFNFDESVTDMPGTFCYRHARSLRLEKDWAFKAAEVRFFSFRRAVRGTLVNER